MQDILVYALAALGLLVVLKHAYTIVYFIYRILVRPQISLTKYGSWAVITGSTDGIGKAYALQFAKKGLNVFLISRSADKLKEVKSEIGTLYTGNLACLRLTNGYRDCNKKRSTSAYYGSRFLKG